MTLGSDQTRKSAKQRPCFCCGQKINVEDNYIYRKGANYDGLWEMHMHPECKDATQKWSDADWEGFLMGDLERPQQTVSATA